MEVVKHIALQLMKMFIASLLFLPILVACFPLVEVKVVNTSIMDKGDGTNDTYSRGDDMLTDEEVLNLEAELVK